MKTAIVLGTRPEIIKLAPLIKKLKNSSLIFTGQHYDYEMSLQFIKQLGLPTPNYSLKISKSNPSQQMGEIIIKLSKILSKIKPETVIVQGDTNTVLAASISSLKSKIPVSHVESGLRSFDWRMPEEHNRIATDHISELLFAPTKNSQKNLKNEKVHGKIFVTGNTVIDSINMYSKISATKSSLDVFYDEYVLMTLHRAENVDNKTTLSSIINAIVKSDADFIFPIHPRTIKRLKEFNLYKKLKNSKNVSLLNSVGYFEILELMKNCSFIISDSGGIQEEATAPSIRKKVLVLRKTTDRPESVKDGFSTVIGTQESKILKNIKKTMDDPVIKSRNNPFGKGNSSDKIIKILKTNF
ncbi:UDP-N-acetylglucosamine 2-epimerase protein [Marine Group I thaumarchaeote SCGC AAA799-P11]|uniref:UDP-N-acetylglucosamine 2-epimerase protein n=1 Tax=Marine Group I thaumarchaeote SCGC AAA799-P11 TaxID=1502295 RepID=A0A087RZ79_9ARCH|nr:UDP-N-acetylglucosamine 2-epimerase protein [Marine Group I thaumarchaeote SCGC AAA799-P11]